MRLGGGGNRGRGEWEARVIIDFFTKYPNLIFFFFFGGGGGGRWGARICDFFFTKDPNLNKKKI